MLLEYLQSILNSYFCKKKKGNELFHFGRREYNIIHCQVRKNASNWVADLHKQCLSDTPMCEHCIDSVEDAHHPFFLHDQNIQLLEELFFAKQSQIIFID